MLGQISNQFSEISLTNKRIFRNYLKKYPPLVSELTFTNLYMWRNYYQFRWQIIENNLCIISEQLVHEKNILILFPPIGNDPISAIKEIKNNFENEMCKIEMHRVDEGLTQLIKSSDIHILENIEDRNNWDYIYERELLTSLPGKHYLNIRKKINKFRRENNWKILNLSKNNINLCLGLQEEWCNLRNCDDDTGLRNEDAAIKDIFENWAELQFKGIILMVNDKVEGYAIGEPLNNDTIVCHVEKGNYKYTGIYQMLNQIFAERVGLGYKFINREQDLGDPGLRTAKMRYHPSSMGKKYTIKL